jgi:hypothetical protein
MYLTDKTYPVGTVMYVHDVDTLADARAGEIPVGVISEYPAFLMNNTQAMSNGQSVALKGRVPVRVIGSCKAGQPVYVGESGVATPYAEGQSSIFIVGIALTSKDTEEEGLVECILKV